MTAPADRLSAVLERLAQGTSARVFLGRHGAGVPTAAAQAFLLDHARARAAVWSHMDMGWLAEELGRRGLPRLCVASGAADRAEYLRRPDLGRQLSGAGRDALSAEAGGDVAIVLADGLSATAVMANALPVLDVLLPALDALGLRPTPIILAQQARVALGDPIAQALGARIAVVLIGERPGLSASDSLGAYVTYEPRPGLPDARRNCISNIRDGGLGAQRAGEAIAALIRRMLAQQTSGITLAAERLRIDNAET